MNGVVCGKHITITTIEAIRTLINYLVLYIRIYVYVYIYIICVYIYINHKMCIYIYKYTFVSFVDRTKQPFWNVSNIHCGRNLARKAHQQVLPDAEPHVEPHAMLVQILRARISCRHQD